MEEKSPLLLAVQEAAQQLLPRIVNIRRHLHANPELSFKEFKTADFVTDELEAMGISCTRMSTTGVVALIQGKKAGGTTIALRADLDALPITEKNTTEYVSKNEGVMHACGHDVHTSSLLGAAQILNDLREHFAGTIKLIFQPGEEVLPGGASIMIKDGVLENPAPELIFAQHVFPSLKSGQVGFRSGMYMASTDELHVTVYGKGGHAAMVHDYVNPVLIGSTIIAALNAFFMDEKTRLRSAAETPTVLAFGKFTGMGATNVIPETVSIQGTFRTMNEEWRLKAHEFLIRTAEGIAKEMGGRCEFRIDRGYPVLFNDAEVTERARWAAEEYLGKNNVAELDLRMTAEDFAFYSQKIPACFYRLGTSSRDGRYTSGVHSPDFDIDEKALQTGAGLMAWIALSQLLDHD
jgi:amidohydrolase